MNVRTVCLAILYEDDASGYEIRKRSIEGEYAYFTDASYGAIYPALARLEKEKLVTARIEVQDGKPSKRIYSITGEGRSEFLSSLYEELDDDEFRSDFILFLRFVGELPRSLVEQRLNERLADIERQLTDFDELMKEHKKPADEWIIGYGRTCMAASRDYIHAHRGTLLALARPDAVDAEAAE